MTIDIGSGHKPHRNADILLEHRLGGKEHRWDKKIKVDRPTVIYDGQIMPFKNKTFDFSICRHVLEHVDSPERFLGEIERISSAGYIETPSEMTELIFTPYPFHEWIIHSNGKKLFIRRKLEENTSRTGKLFDYLCDHEKGFEKFFYARRRSLFLVEYYWKSRIAFQMVKSSRDTFNDLYDSKTLKRLTKLNSTDYEPISERERIKNWSVISNFLEEHLIAPCCSTSVKFQVSHFSCISCQYEYPVIGKKVQLYIT